jgi:hypothetical protein
MQLEKTKLLLFKASQTVTAIFKFTFTYFIINKSRMIFKRNNVVDFSAQETPEEKLPTDLQLEKAKLLCCFRQAKQ